MPLRKHLLAERELFLAGPNAASAQAALAQHLRVVVADLEPQRLGLYWPFRSEFNAPLALAADEGIAKLPWALPFARRQPVEMHYRDWDGEQPTQSDECGIPTSTGEPVLPDVVLVPCLGYTRRGFRLGYGGGYFDRWLAAHRHVTALGVAWSVGELDDEGFAARSHDVPLTLIVTEAGVV